jgi:flagellar motility protein MotE (MotC chaperone)
MASKAVKMAVLAIGGITLFGGATVLFITLKRRQQPPVEDSAAKPSTEPGASEAASGATDPNAAKGGEDSAKPADSAAKPKHEEGAPEPAGDAARTEDATAKVAPPEGSAKGPPPTESLEGEVAAADVTFKLPSPYTESQFASLMRSLESAKSDLERRTAAADVREATLERMRADLDDRRDELGKLREQILAKAKELDEKKSRFDREIVRLSAAEESNIEGLASVYDAMPADAAAERLVALGSGEAAKILSRVDRKKTAKIIAAMPVEKASEVTSRLGKLLPPTPDDPGTEGK